MGWVCAFLFGVLGVCVCLHAGRVCLFLQIIKKKKSISPTCSLKCCYLLYHYIILSAYSATCVEKLYNMSQLILAGQGLSATAKAGHCRERGLCTGICIYNSFTISSSIVIK